MNAMQISKLNNDGSSKGPRSGIDDAVTERARNPERKICSTINSQSIVSKARLIYVSKPIRNIIFFHR